MIINKKYLMNENPNTTNKDRLLLRVEKLLHGMFTKISAFETQQEISDAIKALELAKSSIEAPPIRMDELKPPSVNTNRKGRKAKQGVKSSTERLQTSKELFDEYQTKNIKEKEDDNIEKKENCWRLKRCS
ncbi:hypothetical protein HPULCUR_003127 [Helicostylum pulchrum]|uniref:Uncharacterized protein n=1 Tax=Helicostylum pulchrum TaxID=562976 RepID=A0ABP9XTJ7_9FUNG